ncbi:hypothetical protein [Kribbella sindirgiensis]|uniref:Uncharacterized protein n=1 Tax=Kribbella sindirgiensis TaxID=1124744 RepID=A0A4R0IZR8_9ACTN|nr:hypothetical protein [Kribbella sindirgiensis]TCC37158.1 hypothetical protein E0H50_10885 [Kribbella sindirgiensis]
MSRDRLINDLTEQIARTAIRSANLSAEDRMLAGTRVQRAIAVEATGAHHDVAWAAVGDQDDPRAENFAAYTATNDRPHVAQDRARPEGAAARDLAAELLAADTRTNTMDERTTEYAKDYIAHAVIFAAEAEAKKLPSGPSQAPAASKGAALAAGSAGGAAAGGAEATPVGPVLPTEVDSIFNAAAAARRMQPRPGPSIG